ncbi:hypothetical protein [Streptomyces sp. NPDC047009]|uniref:hypothetical protein n=1 Tax=unclassified Streptomyces TaxID=2593676 RepID=UPI0033F16096
MDWKFLLGLELNHPGFDFMVLGDFRAQLIERSLEKRVLGRICDLGCCGQAVGSGRTLVMSWHRYGC